MLKCIDAITRKIYICVLIPKKVNLSSVAPDFKTLLLKLIQTKIGFVCIPKISSVRYVLILSMTAHFLPSILPSSSPS